MTDIVIRIDVGVCLVARFAAADASPEFRTSVASEFA